MGGRLIILCGLPGSGKTTVAKELEADGAMRMCSDDWMLALGFDIDDRDARDRLERLQWETTQQLLLRGLTVVDECGVWQRWERDLRRDWARAEGIPVELRFLDAPIEELVERVTERNRTAPLWSRIDPASLWLWDTYLERPDADELALFDGPAAGGSPTPSAVTGRLILACGLAGAGKTTLAKELEADGAVRMCPDEWLMSLGFDIYDADARVRVERLQWKLARQLLLRGLTVVDECGVWQRWERDMRREWAREHGVAVELRFLDAPIDVLVERVGERNRTAPEGAPRIDPNLVKLWDDRIQRPDADELALFD